ncbi:hypothetical protein BD311DRAFT_675135, partial [Dichomitus squalens]
YISKTIIQWCCMATALETGLPFPDIASAASYRPTPISPDRIWQFNICADGHRQCRLLLGNPDQHLPDLLLPLSSVLLIHVRTPSASAYSVSWFSVFTLPNHEHAPTKLSTYCEFVFMLQGNVYLRYNPFATPDDFKK